MRINTCSHFGFGSDLGLFSDGKKAQRLLLNFWDLKVDYFHSLNVVCQLDLHNLSFYIKCKINPTKTDSSNHNYFKLSMAVRTWFLICVEVHLDFKWETCLFTNDVGSSSLTDEGSTYPQNQEVGGMQRG